MVLFCLEEYKDQKRKQKELQDKQSGEDTLRLCSDWLYVRTS